MKNVIVVVLLLLLLAACSSEAGEPQVQTPQPDSNSSESTTPPAPEVIPDEPATLVFYSWGNAPEASFNELYGDPVRKKFPHYTIEYIQRGSRSVQDVFLAGQHIDIYFDSIGNFSHTLIGNELHYDMTELIKKHQVDINGFEPTAMDAMRQISGGGLYGLPISNMTLLLYVNKAVFDKFAVPYPKNGMFWDEIQDISKRLTRVEGGKQYRGINFTVVHPIRMTPFSSPLADPATGKAAINTDNWRNIFQLAFIDPYRELDPTARQNAAVISFKRFAEGQEAGMMVDLSSNPSLQSALLDLIDWEMIAMPTFRELPGVGAQLYPTYASITAQSKFKDAGMRVIQFLASEEYQLNASRKGAMPALTSEAMRKALGQDTKYKDKDFQAVYFNKFAPIAPKTLLDYQLEKIYTENINELVKGNIDINTFLRAAEERGNLFLEAEKKK